MTDLSDRKKVYEKGRVPLENEALKKLLRQASGLVQRVASIVEHQDGREKKESVSIRDVIQDKNYRRCKSFAMSFYRIFKTQA